MSECMVQYLHPVYISTRFSSPHSNSNNTGFAALQKPTIWICNTVLIGGGDPSDKGMYDLSFVNQCALTTLQSQWSWKCESSSSPFSPEPPISQSSSTVNVFRLSTMLMGRRSQSVAVTCTTFNVTIVRTRPVWGISCKLPAFVKGYN